MSPQISTVALCVLGLSACKVLSPYDSEFSCPGATKYGKCTNVEGAYSEALGGTVIGTENEMVQGSAKKPKASEAAAAPAVPVALSRYKEAEYNELAKLIEAPVTPVVRPAEVLRTVIVGYGSSDKVYYAPRYIFYFASEPGFVLGDEPASMLPGSGSRAYETLFPNGAKE